MTRFVDSSRLLHGIEHNVTEEALAALENVKVRQVYLSHGQEQGEFQALRYENDGGKIAVQRPLPKSLDERNVEDEKTLTVVQSKDVIPKEGTPVVCHSLRLRSMSHLNGKIGDVRAYSEDKSCCVVHFEEEGLESIYRSQC